MGWASKLVNNPAVINALKGVKADASAAPAATTTVTQEAPRRYRRMTADDIRRLGLKSGGSVKSASARADGIAKKGKTKGRII